LRRDTCSAGSVTEEIEDLQETWMRHVDVVLQDDAIVSTVHQALSKRCPNSSSHGRPGYPAEVVLRLLILKHVRNWSYAVLEREVRANWAVPKASEATGADGAACGVVPARGARAVSVLHCAWSHVLSRCRTRKVEKPASRSRLRWPRPPRAAACRSPTEAAEHRAEDRGPPPVRLDAAKRSGLASAGAC
jgi:hypothetical protein